MPSVANQGEWSQGSVFDVYFLFAEPGDQYLGRCLVGLDPNSPNFSVLPPHFLMGLEDPDVALGINTCFGDLGTRIACSGILLFLLASMIHHIDFIYQIAASNPEHAFNQLSILSHPNLIERLQCKLTTEPSTAIPQPTGIPPHVKQAFILEKLLSITKDTFVKLTEMASKMQQAVREAIEVNDQQSVVK
jgi:hypothetical protein